MDFSYDFNGLIPTKYRVLPLNFEPVASDVEYQDGGIEFNENAETALQEWEFVYRNLTTDNATELDKLHKANWYTRPFEFTDKNSVVHTNCYFVKNSFIGDHDNHKSWKLNRSFRIVKYDFLISSDLQSPTAPVQTDPTNVAETTLTLNWNAATDNVAVTSYQYKIGLGGSAVDVGLVLTKNLVGLAEDTSYTFYIRAKDAAGNVSAWSNAKTVSTIGPPTFLLDEITTNVLGAWSLRKLRADYTGPCLRIKRHTDSAEMDIGFDENGDYDQAAHDAFLAGGAHAIGKKFYNQSGDGTPSDYDMVAAGAQSNGSWSTRYPEPIANTGGLPYINMDAGGQVIARWETINAFSSIQYFQVCHVWDYKPTPSWPWLQYLWAFGTDIRHSIDSNSGANFPEYIKGFNGTLQNFGTIPNSEAIHQATEICQSGNDEFFLDGVSKGTAQIGDTSRSSLKFNWGNWGYDSYESLYGKQRELILLDGGFDAGDQATIEASQKAYWGTP